MADNNLLKICPYDSSHKIPACKFQMHLIKCAKSHPEISRQMQTCPFNSTHIVFGSEFDNHIHECPDKKFKI